MIEKIHTHWKKYKKVWIIILILFAASRLILLGISSITMEKLPMGPYHEWKEGLTVQYPILSRFAVWDSKWYMMIAEHGYADAKEFDPHTYSSVGFFPLYGFLIYLLNFLTFNSLVSGIIIANACLIVSAFLLYLLTKETEDEATAERTLWYLFLFPSAYIFSAVYPESLLLMLWLGTILSAQKGKWLLVGIIGFLAAMTKPFGIFILLPVLLIYFKKRGWKKFHPDVLLLGLIPLGLLCVSYIHFLASGDPFAYSHVQEGAWAHHLSNPLATIFYQIAYSSFDWAFNSWIVLLFLIILIAGYKKLPRSYWIFTLCALLFIPTNGLIIGVWRYIASFFPLIMLLAIWGRSEKVHQALVISMALLQGCLFVFWILGYWFVS